VNAAGATISSLVGGGGPRILTADLNNQGTLNAEYGLTMNANGATHENSGTITISTQALAVSGADAFDNTGTIQIIGGGSSFITMSGTGAGFTTSGTLSIGSGHTLTVTNGPFAYTAGTLDGAGTLALTGLTASFTPSVAIGTTHLTGLRLASTSFTGPTVTVAASATLELTGNTTVNAAVDNHGLLEAQGGVISITGALTTGASSTIRVHTGVDLTSANGFTNNGLIELTSISGAAANLEVTSGTLVNAAGATISSLVGGGGPRILTADLNNQGTLNAEYGLTMNGQLIVPNTVTSSITGTGATLTVAGLDVDGLTIDNVVLISTGGTLTRFDNVTFQNMDPAATQFTINHPGAASALTFNALSFLTAPSTGLYLSVTDTAGDANLLTINLPNSNPADGSSFTSTAGGAVVNW
jgi:hypothetical protein